VALIALLINTAFNLLPRFTGGTKIKQEQIDSLRTDLKKINSNIDSISGLTKQTTKKIYDELKKKK
jgi:response regulator of citrate/malate metabolism